MLSPVQQSIIDAIEGVLAEKRYWLAQPVGNSILRCKCPGWLLGDADTLAVPVFGSATEAAHAFAGVCYITVEPSSLAQLMARAKNARAKSIVLRDGAGAELD